MVSSSFSRAANSSLPEAIQSKCMDISDTMSTDHGSQSRGINSSNLDLARDGWENGVFAHHNGLLVLMQNGRMLATAATTPMIEQLHNLGFENRSLGVPYSQGQTSSSESVNSFLRNTVAAQLEAAKPPPQPPIVRIPVPKQ